LSNLAISQNDPVSNVFTNNCYSCKSQRITEKQKKVVITDRMWARLLSSTNQPSFMSAKCIEDSKKVDDAHTDTGKTEHPSTVASQCNGSL
jgi:hypothetical protein